MTVFVFSTFVLYFHLGLKLLADSNNRIFSKKFGITECHSFRIYTESILSLFYRLECSILTISKQQILYTKDLT